MRRAMIKVGYVVNVVLAIPLLLSYLSVHISPAIFWPLAFFGLAFPIFLAIHLLFLLGWVILAKRYAFISLLTILIGWNHVLDFWGFHPGNNRSEDGIKLMTYNVKNFDLYNWSKNRESREVMYTVMEAEAPDILCVQEFYSDKAGRFENIDGLKKRLHLENVHVHNRVKLRNGADFGQATFTRFPILHEGYIDFEGTNNLCIFSDLLIKGDTIRVYNVHLQSIYLGNEGETYIQRLLREQDTDVESSKRILQKLKTGYINRAPQANIIAAAIRESPHPVIVCGDFNDTPVSYTYHTVSNGLQDAFQAQGWGIGATFAGKIPWLRIDHVLLDKGMTVLGYDRIESAGSDHYPVVTWWQVAAN